MIYSTGCSTFETFADNLDKHYLFLDEIGYDLCALEGIHVIPVGTKHEQITLLFNEDYGKLVTVTYPKGTDPVIAIISHFQ